MASRLAHLVRPVDDLAELVADHDVVLLGEATHGTHDFYGVRADVTRRLVCEHGFAAIAWEADWPPAVRLTRYLREEPGDPDAVSALGGFAERFPTWMWANPVIAGLADQLRGRGAGVYGLDLYSLRASMAAVVAYLAVADPSAARRARERYACFDAFDDQAYGHAAATGQIDPCEDDVVAELVELRRRAAELSARDGRLGADAHFLAERNAQVAANAERYYRAMYRGRESTWNLRDRHMADTLDALLEHVGGPVVVWAHNSHVGDARATSMSHRGELNLGQLVRERHGARCALVGFTTHRGEVTAAANWDGPPLTRTLRPSLEGSVERALHDAGIGAGLLDLRGPADALLDRKLLTRMVGVVYRPETERVSHYLHARPSAQFDVLVHLDRTSALAPLTASPPAATTADAPETYPSGT